MEKALCSRASSVDSVLKRKFGSPPRSWERALLPGWDQALLICMGSTCGASGKSSSDSTQAQALWQSPTSRNCRIRINFPLLITLLLNTFALLRFQQKAADGNHAGPSSRSHIQKNFDMIYTIEDAPPWYLCILLGFQVTKMINESVKLHRCLKRCKYILSIRACTAFPV